MAHQNKGHNKDVQVSQDMLRNEVISLYNIVQDISKGYLTDNKSKHDDIVFCAVLSVKVFKRILFEDYTIRKVITSEEKYDKIILPMFSGKEDGTGLPITENEMGMLYNGIIGLEIKYSIVGDNRRLFKIITEEVLNTEKELAGDFQDVLVEDVNYDILVDEGIDYETDDEKVNVETSDGIIIELEDMNEVPLGHNEIKPFTDKMNNKNNNPENRSDNLAMKIKELLSSRVYQKLNNLLITYHVSTDKIIGNIKLGEIAVVLGVRPEDIVIIINNYPYDNLPVDENSRMFNGDLNETFEKVKELSKNIDKKIKKVKEIVSVY
ncbi:hypothetical protein J7J90_03050 [Candidatus Micrarchaeota archaeon]|nr:hypothetical protein [Candidatus Micrarchaeota archaeon]